KDRENEEVRGWCDKENEEACGRYEKDGDAGAQADHAQGSPEPLRPTRVQGVARLPLRHAPKCAVLRSSTWRMLEPSSSPSAERIRTADLSRALRRRAKQQVKL